MTVRKIVLTPTGSPFKLEYSAGNLIYLTESFVISYSGCSLYHPHFFSSGSTYSLLSCGDLVSNTATIGNYVIEWRLNSTSGTIVLISGNSGNPDISIETYHPFIDIPVLGGALYPVIKYVYIDGYKYTSSFEVESRWSPDLATCIGPILVSDMTCYNGTLVDSNYTHTIDYNANTMNPSQATRSVNFILNDDGTTKNFSYIFYGYQVADTIKITYTGSTTQVLDYWLVGTNVSSNYTSNPKVWGSTSYYRDVYGSMIGDVSLTGISYVSGDALKIDITPNNVTTNTNWKLDLKCQTAITFADYDSSWFPYGSCIIDNSSINIKYVTGVSYDCYYEISFNTYSGIGYYDFVNSYFYKYMPVSIQTNYINWVSGSSYYFRFADYTSYYIFGVAPPGSNNCQASSGEFNVDYNKDTNVVTLTFSNLIDYNLFKDDYLYVSGSTSMSNYTNDNTQVEHFKRYQLDAKTSCSGDNYSAVTFYYHYSSPVVFDDTNKIITITLSATTNGITQIPCNTKYILAESEKSTFVYYYINNVYTDTSFNFNTNVTYQIPVSGRYIDSTPVNIRPPALSYAVWGAGIPASANNNVFDLSGNTWSYISGNTGDGASTLPYLNPNNGPIYIKFVANLKIVISDVDNPIGNTIIYSGLTPEGVRTDTWTQIYP